MIDMVLVRCDGWEALYVDGVAVSQNHSLDWPYVLDGFLDVEVKWAQNWMDNTGSGDFPTELSEIEFDD